MKVLILYAPVIHRGYLTLLNKHHDADVVYILGEDIVSEWDHIFRKDIRSVAAEIIEPMIKALDIFPNVEVLHKDSFASLQEAKESLVVIMPREEISIGIAEKYLSGFHIQYEDIFLRWNRNNVETQRLPSDDRQVDVDALHLEMMGMALAESIKSFDWWIQVGAVAVTTDGIIFSCHNKHLPTEQTPYIVGDPRGNFKRGIKIDLTTAAHAEEQIVARAAQEKGLSLKGSRLYVTTFPCPRCAHLVALSGVKHLYYRDGYAVLDGEDVLRSFEVEIVRVV